MKSVIFSMVLVGALAGCQSVSQADLYKANFGRQVLPAENFDPATITNGPYNPFNQKQGCGAAPACAPSARTQWLNEFY